MSHDNLTQLINRLKLFGIRDIIEERLRQAQEQQLSYREFFNLLLQDEAQYRDAKTLARRIICAKFEEEKTIEGLEMEWYEPNIQKMIRELACGHYLTKHQHVLIMGTTGAGKTHLAQGLGHHACRQGKNVLFIRASILFRTLLAARADQTWGKVFKKFTHPDLLIIDDFAIKTMTSIEAEDMYELIAERHMKGSMIVTSNRSVDGWLELFPDPVMANASMDRLAHQAYQIELVTDESFRKKKRPVISK
jgi:DNA replication protein DnaC